MEWQPIASAPKDRPIVGLCNHKADPYHEPEPSTLLTTYGAHAEGLSHAADGPNVVVWGGNIELSDDEGGGYIPDWWFVYGSDFETVANPTHWSPIPEDM